MVFDPLIDKMELDPREVRVLGCLIEKALSTPDYYPMTLNALTTACNQKTNRDPVVDYDTSDVAEAIDSLQRKRLVGNASSAHDRTAKYRHALAEAMHLDESQLAVLSSLMVRGPETVGELRGRTTRLHEFDSLEEVEGVLDRLAQREPPLVTQLPRRPGQKEARYAHLFSGEPDADAAPHDPHSPRAEMEERINALEQQVEDLRARLDDYAEAFKTFRSQFE